MANGLSTAGLGIPDHDTALAQHAAYCRALESCGLDVTVLDPDEDYPDSTFIEDTALVTESFAVITNPGAVSRRGETEGVEQVLTHHFDVVEHIRSPGTLDAGDVMMVGDHFFIGLSDRTNPTGAEQLIGILERRGKSGSTVLFEDMLHLKSGVAYLERNRLAVTGSLANHEAFASFEKLAIPAEEAYAANCVWINGTVLVAAGFPQSSDNIAAAGYEVLEVDVSEFRKLDGGLSCLSLRF